MILSLFNLSDTFLSSTLMYLFICSFINIFVYTFIHLIRSITKFSNLIGYQQVLFEHLLDSLRVIPDVIGQHASFAFKSISKLNETVLLYLFTKKLNCWLCFVSSNSIYEHTRDSARSSNVVDSTQSCYHYLAIVGWS